jgi:hypothetical protein
MSDETARLALPLLQPSQAQKHVTHNEAIDRLDFLVQLTVKGFDAIVPPAAPETGEAWALDPGAIGAWAGHGAEVASWRGEAWVFATPQPIPKVCAFSPALAGRRSAVRPRFKTLSLWASTRPQM